MPPRLFFFTGGQPLAFRSARTSITKLPTRRHQLRGITAGEKPLPKNDQNTKGPNQDQLPHVSEEAAAMSDVTGEVGPELSQGTPVQEVLSRDKEAQEKAPKIIKEDVAREKSSNPSGTRSFSTSAIRRSPYSIEPSDAADLPQSIDTESALQSMLQVAPAGEGTKFGLPEQPYSRTNHLKHRYDPVVNQVTKLIMRHGKLAQAQKNMEIILNYLRTAPAPKPSANVFPILQSYYNPPVTGYVPPHASKQYLERTAKTPATRLESPHLDPSLQPLDPINYLTLAIDSVAPLVKIRQQRGVLGGGQSLQVPVPLPLKQRRRTSIGWILTAADKRKETRLADRLAREIVAVVEGRSNVWTRREGVHKLGIAARSNIRFGGRRR